MSQERLFPFSPDEVPAQDVCAGKHQGNPASVDAFRRAEAGMPTARAAVLALIRDTGRYGLTARECAALLGKDFNAVSGRCSELKRDGHVCPLVVDGVEQRRYGCAVLVAK